MLDQNQIAAASKSLHDHWRAGTKLNALDAALRPRDRAEGYAIQAAIEHYSSGKLFGWKIAATSEASQKHINVEGPMAGRILSETVLPDGGTASMVGNAMRVGEPEFAFRMSRDLPPRATPYAASEVLDAVDTFHPAIEIPDSRFADFATAGAPQIIADNACAHLFVLGPATGANWRAFNLVEEKPLITLRGKQYIGQPAPAIRRCRFRPAIFSRLISVRWEKRRWGLRRLSPRHCEERSDEAIHPAAERKNGLLRFARNDGVNLLRSEERMKHPCVDIVASMRHGTLYTGVSSNLPKRAFEHREGLVKGFSAKYGCKLLVWYELHETMIEAITREKQIKAGSRAKKLALIEALNPDWKDLYETLI